MYSIESDKITIHRQTITLEKDGLKELVVAAQNFDHDLLAESLDRFESGDIIAGSLENIDPDAIEFETVDIEGQDFLAYVNFPSVLKIDPVKNGDEDANSPDLLIPADIIAQLMLNRLQRDGVLASDVVAQATLVAKSWLSDDDEDPIEEGDLSLEVGVGEENIFLILEQETETR